MDALERLTPLLLVMASINRDHMDVLETFRSELINELRHLLLKCIVLLLEIIDEEDEMIETLEGKRIFDFIHLHLEETD